MGPRDVLIAVHAASVNPIDCKLRRGYQRAVVRWTLPQTLGLDASGVVEAVGEEVTRFAIGDAVYTSPGHQRQGTYADYVAVDESMVAFKPRNVSHAEAAGVPLAGLTAWQSLVGAARLTRGDRILIQAGTGGVGSLAVQIAKHRGAEVIATASAKNHPLLRALGADQVIDYRNEDVVAAAGPCQVAFDTTGGEGRLQARQVLGRGGRLVSIVGGIPEAVERHGPTLGAAVAMGGVASFALGCLVRGIRFRYVVRKPDGAALGELTALVEAGKLQPIVDSVFPLEQVAEAHRHSEAGRARGKIIVAVHPEATEGGATAPPA